MACFVADDVLIHADALKSSVPGHHCPPECWKLLFTPSKEPALPIWPVATPVPLSDFHIFGSVCGSNVDSRESIPTTRLKCTTLRYAAHVAALLPSVVMAAFPIL